MSNDDNAIKPEAAQAQAAEYLGVTAGITFDLDGAKWTLPNPAFLTPEQRKRHKEHQQFMKTMDKETVPHPIIDGKMIEQFVYPYEKDGKLVDEDELLCIALMGEDVYKKFIATGGAPGQIAVHWNVMNRQLAKRMAEDSKSR
ncbi:hypothetical protein A5761_15005 [Mycolicibacterium setense]|uniref:hypothetical protein n=1 Tax=Mycolicibacterium setense TaxID=431269 RepID=UPI0007EBA2E0|nr:hypothetical protein [Mycolicibacterium setense]OBB15048.1 hypothetical protein A5761_15005 [Mycolicibacterium setense]